MKNHNNQKRGKKVVRRQPRKDSRDKRVNYDNTRESKFEKDVEKYDNEKFMKDGTNDVSWYAKNPTLLKSASSLNFYNVTGQPLPFLGQGAVPGLSTIYWTPTLGGANIFAVNQAKESMYSFVVHANSRNKSYDANDLMLVTLAGAQCFEFMAWIFRLYGIMKLYDQRNAYLPASLVYAQGVDFEDLLTNLSNMWFDINELVARSSQIWVPNNIPLIARWFWLSTNIYMDAESVKSQYYMFVPKTFLAYNETLSDQGGCLLPITIPIKNTDTGKIYQMGVDLANPKRVFGQGTTANPLGTTPYLYKWSDILAMANAIFEPLIKSQDRGMIFGDILKAYGRESIYAVSEIPADYRVEPVYNKEVLTQIENLSVSRSGVAAFFQNQEDNTLVESYIMGVGLQAPASNDESSYRTMEVLNFHQVEGPTPEQIMISTRLKTLGNAPRSYKMWQFGGGATGSSIADKMEWNQSTTTTKQYHPYSAGTEVVTEVALWNMFSPGISLSSPWNKVGMVKGQQLAKSFIDNHVGNSEANALWNVRYWAAFDWAPWLYYTQTPSSSIIIDKNTPIVPGWAAGDYDNYTIIDWIELYKMHTTAVYSEFGVPTL